MSINAFLAYLQFEKKYSAHTITAYKNDINTFYQFCINEFEFETIENVNYSHIRSWIVSLVNSKISNRSINRKITSLKSYYKFLQKIKSIDASPLVKYKALKTAKKLQVPFSENEIIAAMEIKEEDINFETVRNKLILELFYATGIRRAELINIKLSDIDDVNETLKVIGKRNKERYVPLIKSVQYSLQNYLKFRDKIKTNLPYLFITEKGKKTYDNLVYRIINGYFSNVSSKVKKSPHILRHTFATHLLNQGADLNSVKELLGHSSLASTQVYTHNSLGKLKEIYNQAHPRSRKKTK